MIEFYIYGAVLGLFAGLAFGSATGYIRGYTVAVKDLTKHIGGLQ